MGYDHLIQSRANPWFKQLQADLKASGARRTHTLLLGSKLIEAWASVRTTPAGRRFQPEAWIRLEHELPHALEAALNARCTLVAEPLMRTLAEAGSAPDHALLVRLGPEPTGALEARVLVPWGIQDPGNLGAMFRSAAAFGFDEILLGPGCTDPFSPKALRGSMGAAFLLPCRRAEHLTLDAGRWFALDGRPEALPLQSADLRAPVRLMVGNEGHGWAHTELPKEVQRLAIPMERVESLNAAVAAGIACYEAARQGRP